VCQCATPPCTAYQGPEDGVSTSHTSSGGAFSAPGVQPQAVEVEDAQATRDPQRDSLKAPCTAPPASAAVATSRTKRALVVDDELSNRRLAARMLQRMQISSVALEDGDEVRRPLVRVVVDLDLGGGTRRAVGASRSFQLLCLKCVLMSRFPMLTSSQNREYPYVRSILQTLYPPIFCPLCHYRSSAPCWQQATSYPHTPCKGEPRPAVGLQFCFRLRATVPHCSPSSSHGRPACPLHSPAPPPTPPTPLPPLGTGAADASTSSSYTVTDAPGAAFQP
jgi:hypothetical protein